MDPIKKLYQTMDAEAMDKVRQHRKPPTRFRPSEAADCVRKIWLRLNGQRPAPRTATSDMYGIKGDVDHDTTRQLLNHYSDPVLGVTYDEHGNGVEEMGIKTDFDIEVPSGGSVRVLVSGRADGAMVIDGEEVLLEIKGVGFYKYKWINEAWTDGYRPKGLGKALPGGDATVLRYLQEKRKDWIYQCQTMMALTGHKKCYLIIVDRSTGCIGLHNEKTGDRTGVMLDFDPELWEEIKKKFAYIKYKLNAGTMPAAEFASGSVECTYCPFFYACHGASQRRLQGKTPAILYPGPQMEIYNDEPSGNADPKDSGDQREDAQRQDDDSKPPS